MCTHPECFRVSYRVLSGRSTPIIHAALTSLCTWLMLRYRLNGFAEAD